ncbi:MAG: hypothetical protein Kow0062_05560 [Acidobacteriota bacterium]
MPGAGGADCSTGPLEGVVLVVDDDVALRLLMRETLEASGFDVVEAGDGEEALAAIRNEPPDLVVLDLLMPVRDGLSALREIRQDEQVARLPVIVVTGLDDPGSIRQAFEAGATDFLTKPVQWTVFAERVRYTLRASRMSERYRRAREEAVAALRVKSEFVGSISHELRTPLNGLVGTAELLSRRPLPDEEARLVHDLLESARQMERIVADLLDFTRLEAGSVQVRPRPFALAALLTALERRHAAAARRKSLDLRVTRAGSTPSTVVGDPDRIRQVLDNLVENAIKFTERGTVALECTAAPDGVLFAVEDTGPGIPPSMREAVFAPFRQLDGSTRRDHGGSGLGLAICRRLVDGMGGTIRIRDARTGGARFEVLLPLRSAEADAPGLAALPAVAEEHASGPAGLRVLVVEDHPINRRLAVRMLESLGHRTVEAENGRDAIAAALGERFDVILMDLQMPLVDGFDAAKEIRRHERARGGHETPIIALTAHAAPEFEARCRAAGMDGFVSKPLHLDDLSRALARACGARTSAGSPSGSGTRREDDP